VADHGGGDVWQLKKRVGETRIGQGKFNRTVRIGFLPLRSKLPD
jgi:hypothetical protein